jgi:hypothetical protein
MIKSKTPLFEVIREGRVLMSANHKSCIYPNVILLSMQAAGYKFRMNGKAWRPEKPEKKPTVVKVGRRTK